MNTRLTHYYNMYLRMHTYIHTHTDSYDLSCATPNRIAILASRMLWNKETSYKFMISVTYSPTYLSIVVCTGDFSRIYKRPMIFGWNSRDSYKFNAPSACFPVLLILRVCVRCSYGQTCFELRRPIRPRGAMWPRGSGHVSWHVAGCPVLG